MRMFPRRDSKVHTAHHAADRRAAGAAYDRASGRFTLPPRTALVFVVAR